MTSRDRLTAAAVLLTSAALVIAALLWLADAFASGPVPCTHGASSIVYDPALGESVPVRTWCP